MNMLNLVAIWGFVLSITVFSAQCSSVKQQSEAETTVTETQDVTVAEEELETEQEENIVEEEIGTVADDEQEEETVVIPKEESSVQKLIDEAAQKGQKLVKLPAGNYKIGSINLKGVVLEGAGKGKTILEDTGNRPIASPLIAMKQNNSGLKHLSVKGSANKYTNIILIESEDKSSYIDKVNVDNVAIDNSKAIAARTVWIKGNIGAVKFTNCDFIGIREEQYRDKIASINTDFKSHTTFLCDVSNTVSNIVHNRKIYVCLKTHEANKSNEPSVGKDWQTYWRETTRKANPTWQVGKTYYHNYYSDAQSLLVSNCTFKNGANGIVVYGKNLAYKDFTISESEFTGIFSKAIMMYHGSIYSIRNNKFVNCIGKEASTNESGVVWLDMAADIFKKIESKGEFINNQFINCKGNAIFGEGLQNNFVIRGNTIENQQSLAVKNTVAARSAEEYSTEKQKQIPEGAGVGGNGILLTGGCVGVIIEDNTIKNCEGAGIALDKTKGIKQNARIANIKVAKNEIKNNKKGNFDIAKHAQNIQILE